MLLAKSQGRREPGGPQQAGQHEQAHPPVGDLGTEFGEEAAHDGVRLNALVGVPPATALTEGACASSGRTTWSHRLGRHTHAKEPQAADSPVGSGRKACSRLVMPVSPLRAQASSMACSQATIRSWSGSSSPTRAASTSPGPRRHPASRMMPCRSCQGPGEHHRRRARAAARAGLHHLFRRPSSPQGDLSLDPPREFG